MKRFSTISSMVFVFALVGLVAADSASAAGLGRRGRTSCDCAPACAAEPGCAACASEPACGAAEPACAAAEPACAAESNCCEPRRRGRLRAGILSRRSKECCGESCTSCCSEPEIGRAHV